MDSPAAPTAPLRLLIVDDSESVRLRLVRALSAMPGIELIGAANDVAPALIAIEAQHPDVMVLDLHLPGGNGLDILQAIKDRPGAPRVIVFTNFAAEPYRRAAMLAGAEEFLDKSLEFATLESTLSRWSREPRRSRQSA